MTNELQKCLLWSAAAVAVMVSCFCVNLEGAWYGGPAGMKHLFMTVFYAAFWMISAFHCGKSKILFWISCTISVITLISSAVCLMAMLFDCGELVIFAVLLSVFSAVPMYGLRAFLNWTHLYAAGVVFSLCCLCLQAHRRG